MRRIGAVRADLAAYCREVRAKLKHEQGITHQSLQGVIGFSTVQCKLMYV